MGSIGYEPRTITSAVNGSYLHTPAARNHTPKLAQICQLPAEYDFPRVNLAPCFHYTGPLQAPSGLEPVLSHLLTVTGLPSAIERVLSEESYKQNALRLQEAIGRSGGVSRAADIIEQVASTRKPVLGTTEK